MNGVQSTGQIGERLNVDELGWLHGRDSYDKGVVVFTGSEKLSLATLVVYNYHKLGLRRERAMFREREINSAAFAYYRRLGRVQRFVNEHYADRITLEKAADIACLEKKYFSTYFRSKTGVRFVDWVTWVRISHAMDLIRREDKPISLVSEATGFSDLRTFERAFKKCTGATPTEYKKSVRPS